MATATLPQGGPHYSPPRFRGVPPCLTVRPRRSVLYMPGANTRALEKARTLPADALIFDLEDAVAPDAKEAARANVVAAAESRPTASARSSSAATG